MTQPFTVCAVQMTSTDSLNDNLNWIDQQLANADLQDVQMLVLPETFALFGVKDQSALADQERAFDGSVGQAVRQWAKGYQVWIVAGTVPVMTDEDRLPRARCHVVDADGELVGFYDKIHLFDAEVGDRQGAYRESDSYSGGDKVVTLLTPWGRLGLSVCYDLRFPELFRALNDQGADFVTLPSAFTAKTGEAHWEPLCRARAIENGYSLIAVNQCGDHDAKRSTWGHSMIVDAWGRVESIGLDPGLAFFKLDPAADQVIRNTLPVNANRRL
ncbi:carbon-nitrogen hydrolase family protein [Reinekea blandensis]|uniref:Predicted amidohydrolase n=1 Tax=Reinekea blandensis MED297 TaxID=314283 RepID=A4BGL8_9GAMM|nr:carbon-nitrogen hydrolase family protein [Reinekea blandensis]EAR08666.1 predicted amidohydrolase [Reinekea sp. MED297] [Reinekea blandensis MED297]